MIIVPSHPVIPNVILVSVCSISKLSKDGGSKCGSMVGVEYHISKQDNVGLSPITRFDVEERLPRRFCLGICKAPVMSSPNGHM
jgi:hypothetical protein